MKERRRELRKNSTIAEEILWDKLRNSRLGFRFRRQYSIGGIVIDFYCPRKKVAVEIDGSVHRKLGVNKYDKFKTEYLQAGGIRLVRFWNGEVIKDVEGMIRRIEEVMMK